MSTQSIIERTTTTAAAMKNESEPSATKFRMSKSNSKHSTSSMFNSNGVMVDEDDPFYDATDSSGEEVTSPRIGSSSSRPAAVMNPYIAKLEAIGHLDSVNDDSLFNTPLTSRHPSEICTELNSPRMNTKNVSVFSPSLTSLPAEACQQESDETSLQTFDTAGEPQIVPSSTDKDGQATERQQQAQESSYPQEPVKLSVNPADEDEDEELTPLETPWTFWYDWCERFTSTADFENSLKKIITVNTVEDFWSVFNNIIDVSKLENRYSYHLMRGNRRPIWEDAENSEGGVWKIAVRKSDTSFIWKELAMAAIGEQLSDSVFAKDDIVGISVGRREHNDNISIWNLESKFAGEARLGSKISSLAPGFQLNFREYKAHKTLDTSEVNKFSKRNAANNQRFGKNQQNNYGGSSSNYQLNSSHFSSAFRSNNNSRQPSPSGYQNNNSNNK